MPVIERRYRPRGVCRTLFEDRRGEVLLSGPAGTGKSRACLEKLHLLALKYPGMRGLMVRKTATSLTSTVLVEWRTNVIDKALLSGEVHWYNGSAQEPAQYRYRNGSRIVVGGMDKATRIMSSQYDVAYVNEALELTENDWESITTRLRNGIMPYQQIIADTNPDSEYHWLYLRAQSNQTTMYNCRHEENPLFFNEDGELTPAGRSYIGRLDALTGVRKLRYRDGLWVSAEGTIYEWYDPAVHLIDRFDIPQEWPRYWSIDFGYTNPFVCQMWAEDPDGRLYLYREFYRSQRLVEDHARQILATVTTEGGLWCEPKPARIICDHDAEDRATLTRHLGLATTAAKKTVSDGIQATQSRYKILPDGKPRIFFMRDSLVERDPGLAHAKKPTCTVEEIPGYVWSPAADGKPNKEEPLKKDDHGCDAMRYVVAERDLQPQYRVRWI